MATAQLGGRHCYKSPKRSDETKKSVFLHSRPYLIDRVGCIRYKEWLS